jgi:hypothetical protein
VGSTGPGNPYEMKFADEHGNVCICKVSCPEVISELFDDINCMDVHNQLQQYAIRLEKKWITSNPFFCLHTTMVGINVVDCYQLATYHKLTHKDSAVYSRIDDDDDEHNAYTIKHFAGILAKQLLIVGNRLEKANYKAAICNFTFNPRDELMSSQDSTVLEEEEEDDEFEE